MTWKWAKHATQIWFKIRDRVQNMGGKKIPFWKIYDFVVFYIIHFFKIHVGPVLISPRCRIPFGPNMRVKWGAKNVRFVPNWNEDFVIASLLKTSTMPANTVGVWPNPTATGSTIGVSHSRLGWPNSKSSSRAPGSNMQFVSAFFSVAAPPLQILISFSSLCSSPPFCSESLKLREITKNWKHFY